MNGKKRLSDIKKIKIKILKKLDEIGGIKEITFGELVSKLRIDGLLENVIKKYIGICYDDGLIDINSNFSKNRAEIKFSINKNTKVQITSEGQYYIYPIKKSFLNKIINNPWIYTTIGTIIAGIFLYLILGK